MNFLFVCFFLSSILFCPRSLFSEQSLSLEITSPTNIEAVEEELICLSALIRNTSSLFIKDHLNIEIPEGWHQLPDEKIAVELDPGECKLCLFGVKIPKNTPAGTYCINLFLESQVEQRTSITALIPSKIQIKGSVEGLIDNYPLNEPVKLSLHFCNEGNTSISAIIETYTDPPCDIQSCSIPIILSSCDSVDIPISVIPQQSSEREDSQFVLIKLVDPTTADLLCQIPMTLKFSLNLTNDEDPYIRIPAYFKTIALGDRYRSFFAAEYAGKGLIDPQAKRYAEFFFRVPTQTRSVIYNADECLYATLYDPDWNLELGDTVYELSPLTQCCRYGRGANIEKFGESCSAGIHYTQNPNGGACNPREVCCYVEGYPTENLTVAVNYLHKVEGGIPTSNIATLSAEIEYPPNVVTECEVGQNFLSHTQGNNKAYRIASSGSLGKEGSFAFENAYAGSAFYGYYSHLRKTSFNLEIPLTNLFRLSATGNDFVQNFDCEEEEDESASIIPKQRSFSGNLSYQIKEGCFFILNSFFLRGEDLGASEQYNFDQKWYGCSFFLSSNTFLFNTVVSFGRQKDYLTNRTTNFLQRYYTFVHKDLTPNLGATLFYEGGNTNYYDATPWRNTCGGSLSYRFSRNGAIGCYIQRILQPTDKLDAWQINSSFDYTFKNLHELHAIGQYSRYQCHYPNDMMFMVSYTVPFSLPVCERKDIGRLSGVVYNVWDNTPVCEALVSCQGRCISTKESGNFSFGMLGAGEHTPRIEHLPDQLIALEQEETVINLPGGRHTVLALPVIPSCSIRGKIILYGYEDLFKVLTDPEHATTAPLSGLAGIRLAIASEEEKEIYAATTDTKGEFKFPKLRPGKWHIKIFTEEIPLLHSLNINNLIVEVEPKEDKMIVFKVEPETPQFYKLEENSE